MGTSRVQSGLSAERGIFYLRWPLPRRLHPDRKASSLKLSLRTRDPREALRLARSMSEMGDRLHQYGFALSMTYQEIRDLIQRHYRELLEKQQAAIREDGRLSDDERRSLVTTLGIAEEAVEKKGPISFLTDDADLLDRFINKYKADIKPGTRRYGQLQGEIRIAYRDYLKAVLSYDDNFDRMDFSESPQVAASISADQPDTSLPLKEMADAFIQEKKRGDNWVAKTEQEKTEHIALLREILGEDTKVTTIGPLDAKRVKDTLQKLPKNRSINPLTRGKPLDAVLEMAGVERLKVRTINKYLQTYDDLFDWGRKQGHVTDNRFSELTIQQKRANAGDRDAFQPEDIALMLDTLTGGRPDLINKPYQKWGPLIGIYTGARLNEIAQLEVKDICQKDGVWCFNISDQGDGRRLKTEASRRYVPIHARLKELGFLEFVEEARKTGKPRLFPDFTHSAQNGWGRHLGRWFNDRFLPTLNLKTKLHSFHSLRHTVVTRLMQADIQEQIVKALVGHARQGVTQQHYFKQGYTLQQLDDALQKLDFGTLARNGSDEP